MTVRIIGVHGDELRYRDAYGTLRALGALGGGLLFYTDQHRERPPEATVMDGYVQRLPSPAETFSTIRNAANGTSYNVGGLIMSPRLNCWKEDPPGTWLYTYLQRAFMTFDTSSIDPAATIIAATIRLWCSASNNSFSSSGSLNIYEQAQADPDTLVVADYSQVSSTILSSYIFVPVGGITDTPKYFYFSLNGTGLTKVIKGGISRFCMRTTWDAANIAPHEEYSEMSVNINTADGGLDKKILYWPRLEVILEGEGGLTPRLIGVNGTLLKYTSEAGNLLFLQGIEDAEGQTPLRAIGISTTKLRYIGTDGKRYYLEGGLV